MPHPAERQESMVRVYTKPEDYSRDAAKLAKDGWVAAQVTERQPRRGCGRILLMGVIFAFIFPPKPELVVTYTRTTLQKGFVRCFRCGAINQTGKAHEFCVNCGAALPK